MVKGYQTLTDIDKCVTRIPDTKAKILDNVYEMNCESRLMYGVKMWEFEERWKEIERI